MKEMYPDGIFFVFLLQLFTITIGIIIFIIHVSVDRCYFTFLLLF